MVIVDGKIAEVGEKLKAAAADAAYDLRGATLMPGLIDCHVHCMASHVNLALTARMSNAIAIISALPILKGMLSRGFTTIRDAGGADHSLAQASELGMIDAPRIFPSGKALSQTGGHGDFRARSDQLEACTCHFRVANIARVVDGVDDVRRAARDELTKGATQIKVMASGGVASPNDPIGNTGYSMDELRAIVAEADAWQTYVMAHAYTPKAIRRAVEAGVRTIEHGNLIDEPTAQFLKRARRVRHPDADHLRRAVERGSGARPAAGVGRQDRRCPPGRPRRDHAACTRSACAWPMAATCSVPRTATRARNCASAPS